MGSDRLLALIAVNFGSHTLLHEHLGRHADSLSDLDVRVVVVDNFSSAAELSAIRQAAAEFDWELVESAENLGFGAAVNRAAERAVELGCTALVLVNPDAAIDLDVIVELRDHVARRPADAVSPRIVTPDRRVEFRGSQVRIADGRIRGLGPGWPDRRQSFVLDAGVSGGMSGPAHGWLTGACLALSTTLFEQAGGFDESYFLYWEDLDLSRRIERAGGRLVVRDDLQVIHDEGGTQARASGRVRPDTYYYFNCRNRLTFAARNLDRRAIVRWIRSTPRESWQILLRGGRRDVLGSPWPLLAAARGSLAGLAIALRALLTPGARPPARASSQRPSVLAAHPGAELYGSDRMLLESVDGLIEDGFEVTVALPGPGPLVDELRRHGAQVEFCPMPVLRKSALRPLGFVRLLATAIRGVRPAARLIRARGTGGVYVSTVTVPSWLILGRLLRRPVICHVHEAERSAPRLVRQLLALPTRCAHRVIVNSEYSLDVLAEVAPGVRSRAQVVYNGVAGPDNAPAPPRQRLTGPIRLLFVGRLSPRKGPDVALAAARELVARGSDVQLELLGSTFAGYEWFEQQLRSDSGSPELAGRVHFAGFDPDVWPWLAAADIVIVPSVVDEPFGNTAVEAGLAARPAVVSNTSGLHEAAAGYQAAILVEPASADALADAVEQIVANWSRYASWAQTDSVQMRERYSPARYRAEIAACVRTAGRRR